MTISRVQRSKVWFECLIIVSSTSRDGLSAEECNLKRLSLNAPHASAGGVSRNPGRGKGRISALKLELNGQAHYLAVVDTHGREPR